MSSELVRDVGLKPWGMFSRLYQDQFLIVDHIKAKRGGFSSIHYHERKTNLFVVERGMLQVSTYIRSALDSNEVIKQGIATLLPGYEFVVMPGMLHQFLALEDSWAYEVYWGAMIDPDDIVRLSQNGIKL